MYILAREYSADEVVKTMFSHTALADFYFSLDDVSRTMISVSFVCYVFTFSLIMLVRVVRK